MVELLSGAARLSGPETSWAHGMSVNRVPLSMDSLHATLGSVGLVSHERVRHIF